MSEWNPKRQFKVFFETSLRTLVVAGLMILGIVGAVLAGRLFRDTPEAKPSQVVTELPGSADTGKSLEGPGGRDPDMAQPPDSSGAHEDVEGDAYQKIEESIRIIAEKGDRLVGELLQEDLQRRLEGSLRVYTASSSSPSAKGTASRVVVRVATTRSEGWVTIEGVQLPTCTVEAAAEVSYRGSTSPGSTLIRSARGPTCEIATARLSGLLGSGLADAIQPP